MPSNGKVPLVGTIAAVSDTGVTLRDAAGEHEMVFDDSSFVRGHAGDQMVLADIPVRYRPGDNVIIAFEGGRVVNMRPQH